MLVERFPTAAVLPNHLFCFPCEQLFVVSDSDDPDLHEVVDFRIGSSRGHRLLAAVAEVSYTVCGGQGTFWVHPRGA